MAQRGNSREALLDAAEEIVRENGAAHLSFNAISARAGVSKGGLLYHFPTKEALLQALLERVSVALAEARKAESGKLPESATQELKAHILAAGYFHSRRLQGVGIALLAAGAHDPKLLTPAREAREALVERIHSPILPRRPAPPPRGSAPRGLGPAGRRRARGADAPGPGEHGGRVEAAG